MTTVHEVSLLDLCQLQLDLIGSTLTRWRDRQTGERLLAVAARIDAGVLSVLPVRVGDTHPLDWMPARAFLSTYEPEA